MPKQNSSVGKHCLFVSLFTQACWCQSVHVSMLACTSGKMYPPQAAKEAVDSSLFTLIFVQGTNDSC